MYTKGIPLPRVFSQADPPSADAYLGLAAVVEKMLGGVKADGAKIFISSGPIPFAPLRTPLRSPL
jgi:hypothetical protein